MVNPRPLCLASVLGPLLVLLIALVAGACLSPTAALGAFPGANGRIAYVQTFPSFGTPPSNETGTEIYSVLPDGSDVQRLTHNTEYDYAPSWSADGQRITYESAFPDGPRATVYVMDANGDNLSEVARPRTDNPGPSFSPDGERIAFSTGRTIATSALDGSDRERVAVKHRGSGPLEEPEYSPSGRRIIFAGHPRGKGHTEAGIWTVRSDGTHLHPLTSPKGDRTDLAPDYSPDGTQIVFVRAVPRHFGERVFLMNADGSDEHRITSFGYDYPAFSPAGDRIVISEIANYLLPLCGDLYSITPTGSDLVQVTRTCDQQVGVIAHGASWQPLLIAGSRR
jgi:Tol biopolymer transport system component